jgi:hypothetical protein
MERWKMKRRREAKRASGERLQILERAGEVPPGGHTAERYFFPAILGDLIFNILSTH